MENSVDILMPHYNDLAGLVLSLKSIENQTWDGKKRVVLVDDGSRPDVVKALAEIVEESPLHIDLISNPVNRGRPYVRNCLLDSIDSPYVTWQDAGDEWYPEKLTHQFDKIKFIEQTRASNPTWVTCNYDWAWVDGDNSKTNRQNVNGDQTHSLLKGAKLRAYLWTLLGSAESFKCVGWFDESLPRLQDLDFFIRFTLHQGQMVLPDTDLPLCVYHKSDQGRNAQQIRECNRHIFDKHRVLYNRYGARFVKMRLYNMELLSARFAKNNDDHKLKRHFIWEAFKHKPIALVKKMLLKGV